MAVELDVTTLEEIETLLVETALWDQKLALAGGPGRERTDSWGRRRGDGR